MVFLFSHVVIVILLLLLLLLLTVQFQLDKRMGSASKTASILESTANKETNHVHVHAHCILCRTTKQTNVGPRLGLELESILVACFE
jgi:hypothetical protein